ncbi:hypothetical protein PG984_013214 [Apiospora sp. TS-2023a]
MFSSLSSPGDICRPSRRRSGTSCGIRPYGAQGHSSPFGSLGRVAPSRTSPSPDRSARGRRAFAPAGTSRTWAAAAALGPTGQPEAPLEALGCAGPLDRVADDGTDHSTEILRIVLGDALFKAAALLSLEVEATLDRHLLGSFSLNDGLNGLIEDGQHLGDLVIVAQGYGDAIGSQAGHEEAKNPAQDSPIGGQRRWYQSDTTPLDRVELGGVEGSLSCRLEGYRSFLRYSIQAGNRAQSQSDGSSGACFSSLPDLGVLDPSLLHLEELDLGKDTVLDVVLAINADNGAITRQFTSKGSCLLALVLGAVVDLTRIAGEPLAGEAAACADTGGGIGPQSRRHLLVIFEDVDDFALGLGRIDSKALATKDGY